MADVGIGIPNAILAHSHETKTPLYRSGRQKTPLTISGLKKVGPGWHLRPRAFAPQASVITSSVQDDVPMSIPVSCDGVKMHVFMDDSIGFSGRQRSLFCQGQLDPWFSVHTLSATTELSVRPATGLALYAVCPLTIRGTSSISPPGIGGHSIAWGTR
jgi:hypothetical protein